MAPGIDLSSRDTDAVVGSRRDEGHALAALAPAGNGERRGQPPASDSRPQSELPQRAVAPHEHFAVPLLISACCTTTAATITITTRSVGTVEPRSKPRQDTRREHEAEVVLRATGDLREILVSVLK